MMIRAPVLRAAKRTFSSQVPIITQTKLIIDGKFLDAADGKTFETLDPRTGDVICKVACAGVNDVELAVKAARRAFDDGPWPRMSGRERGLLMNKFADLLETHKDELAALETLDNGKPLAMSAGADIPLTIEHYRYYIIIS
jgi:aldehyde dehydrogenase (NAD+)